MEIKKAVLRFETLILTFLWMATFAHLLALYKLGTPYSTPLWIWLLPPIGYFLASGVIWIQSWRIDKETLGGE